MISELKLKRSKFMETLDKERLARRIVGMLPNMRVMFIYIGGSVAYGTFSPGKSDLDINLFADGYGGAFKVNIPDGDLFVYGREKLVDRFDPESQMSLYKKCFTDDFLSLPETLVYLDPDYRKEYEAYMHTDFAKCMKGYLENFLGYYGFLYNGSSRLGKRFYHVIRVRGQLEEWKRTGVYSLSLPEEYYRREMEFKEGYPALGSRKEWLDLIGRYLDEIGEIKEGLKDG